jgi:hypothetical protein
MLKGNKKLVTDSKAEIFTFAKIIPNGILGSL